MNKITGDFVTFMDDMRVAGFSRELLAMWKEAVITNSKAGNTRSG